MAMSEKQKKAAFVTAFVRAKAGKPVSATSHPMPSPSKVPPAEKFRGQP